MQIQITARSLTLTEDQRTYIEEKISALQHIGKELADPSNIARVEVDYHEVADLEKRVVIEATVNVPYSVICASQDASTVEEGVDLIVEKLFKQIERYRGKLQRRNKEGVWLPIPKDEFERMAAEEVEKLPKITKRKRFSLVKQMHEEEAIEQMELIGHDFYLFWNRDTNRFSVVYKRKDGTYGVIEPKIETNAAGQK